MVEFVHWKRIPEFPFTETVEKFKVNINLDKTWNNINEILRTNGFRMQPHFDGAFVAFPFGASAEEATEVWEGWEV